LPSFLIELQGLVSVVFSPLMMMMIQVGWFLFLMPGFWPGPWREGLGFGLVFIFDAGVLAGTLARGPRPVSSRGPGLPPEAGSSGAKFRLVPQAGRRHRDASPPASRPRLTRARGVRRLLYSRRVGSRAA